MLYLVKVDRGLPCNIILEALLITEVFLEYGCNS